MFKRTVAIAALAFTAMTGVAAAQYPPTTQNVLPGGEVRDNSFTNTTVSNNAVVRSSPQGQALPRTGDESMDLTRVGATLVAAGGAVVFIARRRQRTALA